jgi:DNA repair protein RecO (recombination protein O)
MLTNDCAICIRTIDYSETSQVVTFFSRQTGKVTAIAKGSKRQRSSFGGPLEMFSYGNIVFSDSGRDKLATLVEFEPLSGVVDSSVFSADIFVLNCCLFAGELVNILTKDYDPHPGLFDALLVFLQQASRYKVPEVGPSTPSTLSTTLKTGSLGTSSLRAGQDRMLALLVSFQLSLLREIGLYPVLDYCVNCRTPFSGRWPEVYFSNTANGLICRDCQGAFPDKMAITEGGVKCLGDIKLLSSAQDPTIRQVENVLISYITDTLGRPPKMAKYILNP